MAVYQRSVWYVSKDDFTMRLDDVECFSFVDVVNGGGEDDSVDAGGQTRPIFLEQRKSKTRHSQVLSRVAGGEGL